MLARWADLWLEWLDQFRHLIAPESLRKPYKRDTGEVDPVHGLDAPHPGWRPKEWGPKEPLVPKALDQEDKI